MERYGRLPLRQRLRWWAGLRGRREARVARDVARHFPRHAEAAQGLARGAGVPRAWLEAELARAADDPAVVGEGGSLAVCAGASALVARRREPSWGVRRVRPEGGFACLELSPPWLTGAVAAVSEAGLAAAAVPGPEPADAGRVAAPAFLLVQDALHRVGSLAGALEWCLRRPAGARATLLFADAAGEVAGVAVAGDERRVLRPAEGLLVEAGGREGELAKSLAEAGAPGPEALARILGAPGVVLDPAARRLGLSDPAGALEWIALEVPSSG